MNNVKLNETPLRTSRNFGVNNIKLDNLDIPENLIKFENVDIIKSEAQIDENVEISKLTYGTGIILEDNIKNFSNSKIRIINDKKDTVKIVYNFDEDNLNLAGYIDVLAKADLDLVIIYKSSTNKKCFSNNILRLRTDNDVIVNVNIINLINDSSDVFEAIENEINERAEVNYTIIDLGGERSISNYYSNVVGEKSKNTLKTIYLGKDNEIRDLNYIAELRGKKTEVDIDVQGALKDTCKKVFKGTIDFKNGCSGAKGAENEFCLLLSDKAKSLAMPMLLCTEYDVEGEHSTASGKAESDKLFYIMSRGLSEKEATKLIVKTNFSGIIDKVIDEDIKEEVIAEIDKRLD